MAASNPTLQQQCTILSNLFPYAISTPTDCCTRSGVTCSSTDITGINFANRTLSGRFPDLTQLPQLTSIILSNTTLSRSPFPANLSSLQNLEVLDLEEVKLSGPITALPPKLKKLNLARTGINGTIPANLPSTLEELYIRSNYDLRGVIPADAFSKLPSLKVVDMQYCYFSGSLPELPNSIVRFDGSDNKFNGSIPSSYSSLPSLRYLDIEFNGLTGSLPSLPASIVYFSASANNLTGPLPDVSNLTNLRYFDVILNRLSGKLPDWAYTLMRRSNLTFDIGGNCFTEIDGERLPWSYRVSDLYDSRCGPVPSGVSISTSGGGSGSGSGSRSFEERLVDKLAFKVGIAVGGFVLLLIIAMVWNCFKKKAEGEDKQDVEAVQVVGAGKTDNTPLPVYTPASKVPPRPEAGTATQPNKTYV
ncbi:hypothetical protein HDU96_009686 [Phlyctochytrium bullatum]|nr:hypothetical protein HDU96_009686 [Phlyctochytrium bullatum]